MRDFGGDSHNNTNKLTDESGGGPATAVLCRVPKMDVTA